MLNTYQDISSPLFSLPIDSLFAESSDFTSSSHYNNLQTYQRLSSIWKRVPNKKVPSRSLVRLSDAVPGTFVISSLERIAAKFQCTENDFLALSQEIAESIRKDNVHAKTVNKHKEQVFEDITNKFSETKSKVRPAFQLIN